MQSWGLDHVRLPMDYMLFESDDAPGVYDEARLDYVDRTLRWCKQYGLNLILDLHHAPGFFFGNGDKNDLFTNRRSQERFIAIWKMFARRYQAEGSNLIFELLNELVWNSLDPWNALWQETAAEIFAISPQRRIIIGSNHWSCIADMKDLAISSDERIIYNFHFYEPFLFTHQRASWNESTRTYDKAVPFPFPAADFEDFYTRSGNTAPFAGFEIVDEAFIEDFVRPAVAFAEQYQKTIYCGEYGVYYRAERQSAINWLNAVANVMIRHGIGRAVWSYRGFSAITADDNKTFDADMAAAIARR